MCFIFTMKMFKSRFDHQVFKENHRTAAGDVLL